MNVAEDLNKSAEIYVGTSGYSYTDWVGPFYPEGTSQRAFLEYYSKVFPVVELNFSYYRQPEASMLTRMMDISPQKFLFTIKAHKSITHEVGTDWRKDAAIYKSGIEPLSKLDRLGAVLLQFPYSFHYTDDNRRYLDAVCREFADLPLVVEFRNREWQRDRVYEGLRSRGAGLAVADYPGLENLPLADPVTTSNVGYVRFHGRNRENWWTGTNASRYDYLYSDDELDEWLDKIDQMSRNTRILILVFNNHWRGQAVQNARRITTLLGDRGNVVV